jgi:glyoxylase-like metal-dependent hydrolase (beta-lactamase superfamily II)
MQVEGFFEPGTSTISYLLLDVGTGRCALIDSVLDYDPKSGRTSTKTADTLVSRVRELGAKVERLGGQIAIGAQVTRVQDVFGKLFHAGSNFAKDGSQFDHLVNDGDTFSIGALQARAIHTPGHTPACMTYVVSEGAQTAAFVGDTLFMPDYGTARCDFPGGDARTLYRSINKVLSLPADTRLYLCHDYQPGGRPLQFVSTVAEQRAQNIHIRDGISEEAFVSMRTARDATLSMPVLMLPSVQVNMRAGHLPDPEENGVPYLKIPLNAI